MAQFIAYSLSAFVVLYFESMIWGVSAGPANAMPYFLLLAGLIVFLVAGPAALFLPRIAACIGIAGSIGMFSWPLLMLIYEHDVVDAALIGLLPLISLAVGIHYLWRTRLLPWFSLSRSPHLGVRIPISLIPFAIFPICFNVPLVFQIIVHGP